MDKNIYMFITEKQLLINAKRVEHGLLLERSRPIGSRSAATAVTGILTDDLQDSCFFFSK